MMLNRNVSRKGVSKSDMDTYFVLSELRLRFWRRKHMYFASYARYRLLTLLCFYMPMQLCHLTAAIVPVIPQLTPQTSATVVIAAVTVSSILLG